MSATVPKEISVFAPRPETGWAAVMFDDNKLTAARLW